MGEDEKINENAEIRFLSFDNPPYQDLDDSNKEDFSSENLNKNQVDEKTESFSDEKKKEADSVFINNDFLSSLNIESVIGDYRLEPLMLVVSCLDRETGKSNFNGIPGFYDPRQRKFLLLSGEPVDDKINSIIQNYFERGAGHPGQDPGMSFAQ